MSSLPLSLSLLYDTRAVTHRRAAPSSWPHFTPKHRHCSSALSGSSRHNQFHSSFSINRGGRALFGPCTTLFRPIGGGCIGGRVCGPCVHHRMIERRGRSLCRTVPAWILEPFVTMAVPALPSTSNPSARPTPSLMSSLSAEPGRLRHMRSRKLSSTCARVPSRRRQGKAFFALRDSGTTLKQCEPSVQRLVLANDTHTHTRELETRQKIPVQSSR